MRSWATKILVLSLVWVMTPGLVEVTENLWHLATTGHSAHAPGMGADHAPAGDEHGCSGSFHLCSCHATVVAELALAPPVRPRNGLMTSVTPARPHRPAEPDLSGPDDPPRA